MTAVYLLTTGPELASPGILSPQQQFEFDSGSKMQCYGLGRNQLAFQILTDFRWTAIDLMQLGQVILALQTVQQVYQNTGVSPVIADLDLPPFPDLGEFRTRSF